MAEQHAKFKRFEYRTNSNLVLQRDAIGPHSNEPTGEPESLRFFNLRTMGDLAHVRNETQALSKLKKKRQRLEQDAETGGGKEAKESKAQRKRAKLDIQKGQTVLSDDIVESANYKPTTQATRAAYEQLVAMLTTILGDQSPEVLGGAAHEVLAGLKADDCQDAARKRFVEEILGPVTETYFADIYRLSRAITDFGAEEKGGDGNDEAANDATGVAVVFEEDDSDEEEKFLVEIDELSDSSEDEELLLQEDTGLKVEEDDIQEEEIEDKNAIPVANIDAHWLQREVQGLLKCAADKALEKEKDILDSLLIEDEQKLENKVMSVMGFQHFEFCRRVVKNRARIFYVVRIKQAQTDEVKEEIIREMRESPDGLKVLDLLERSQQRKDKEKETESRLREEARKLNKVQKTVEGDDEDATGETKKRAEKNQEKGKKLLPSKVIDIEGISFANGSRTMTNTACKMPDGATRVQKRAWEEVHIPAPSPPDYDISKLIPIEKLGKFATQVFKDPNKPESSMIKTLNPVQSEVFDVAFNQYDENMLVCAPTGAGKTNIALLTMLNVVMQKQNMIYSEDMTTAKPNLETFKIVYIAPMKALVQQLVGFFTQRFASYGLSVGELSGDSTLSKEQMARTQILVTTPEKWDIITRKTNDSRGNLNLVRLIIIDEIHLLHDTRGPVLEAIVARTLRQMENTQERIRLVGLSATLPNYKDVAAFMRVSQGLYRFDNSYRPCPLQQTFIGVTDKKAIRRMNTMNDVCFEKVSENAGKNQMLIFVHSRKETAKTAKALREMAMSHDMIPRFVGSTSASKEVLSTEVEHVKSQDLKELLPYGFAIHHAGLHADDRKLVEELFADRHIQVLCCTSTLAWGVNLPAHTVIIKGTQVYKPDLGKWDELGPLDMLQMMGRAGRPGMEKIGHGIIITQHSELQYYLSLLNMQLPVESQMIADLADRLIGELVLGTISNRTDAVTWLGYTYLFVRMQKNPTLYGFGDYDMKNDSLMLQARCDLIHAALALLHKHNLIKYDRRTGHIQVTALGRVASHYYIKSPSIAVYNEHLRPSMNDIELLRLFSLSNEFKNIPVRDDEKVELTKLLDKVPIPVKGNADEYTAKVNVLLQAFISKMKLDGFAMAADMVYIEQSAGRIMRALFEIALRRGWANLALRALKWSKMIERRMWSCQTPLRHFKGPPDEVLKRIEKRDMPWEKFYDMDSTQLAEWIKLPKFGKTLYRLVHQFPRLDLSTYVQPKTRSCLMVEVTITPDFLWDDKVHGHSEIFWILVEDVNGEHILHYEQFVLRGSESELEHTVSFTVSLTEPRPPQYFIRVVSDRWLNAEFVMAVSFRHLILPEKTPAHTEVLDLQHLPVTGVRWKDAQEIFYKDLNVFNQIQTQTFTILNGQADNALVCAPAATGKEVCMEFAMFRALKPKPLKKKMDLEDDEDEPIEPEEEIMSRIVYLAPYDRIMEERYRAWAGKFTRLGYSVAKLTGETSADQRILEETNVIITTPERFDGLSRRWNSKKGIAVQQISLLLCDELHLLEDPEVGSIYEAVVSRMRVMKSLSKMSKLRIVGFAASLANAKDLGEWIGADFQNIFNFPPGHRVVPQELVFQGFDIHNRNSRLQAMARPIYQSIKNHSPTKPTIIFVSDRKQCQVTAIDLLLHAAADNVPKRFLRVREETIAQHLEYDFINKREALKRCLSHGVGFLHEGFTPQEMKIVTDFYRSGAIQVLVVSQALCWGFDVDASCVIIADTIKYDGRYGRFVDYPVADVLQMVGRASMKTTPDAKDDSGIVVLLCQASRKEYYRKFVNEAIPVESQLDHRLPDILNAEIVTQGVETKQDGLDWLTWTFYYRRLSQNPNYYGLQGVTHQHLSDHLSELIETAVQGLEQCGCTSVENEMNLSAANLGLVANYYAIRHTTVEVFMRSVTGLTKRKGIIDILCAASEFQNLAVRPGEDPLLRQLAEGCNIADALGERITPNMKTKILLYAHFFRAPLTADMRSDKDSILDIILRIIQGLVDVIASNGNLKQVLMAMEISQMVVQASLYDSSPLLQIPHFTPPLVERLNKKYEVTDVFEFMDLEDADRDEALSGFIDSKQLLDCAAACNRFPSVTLAYKVANADNLEPGSQCKITVNLTREMDEDEEDDEDEPKVGPVYAPLFPKEKEESWWVLVGDTTNNSLLAIKRTAFTKAQTKAVLNFELPEDISKSDFKIYLMCDSYQSVDQEHAVKIKFKN